MRCKICNKKMEHEQLNPAGVRLKPLCSCGKVRTRERMKGCSKCGSPGKYDIMIKKHWYGWLLYCKCGHKWRVRE